LSKQENLRTAIIEEIKRCAVDPVHFFKKYVKIQHPMKGKVNFNLYPFQEDTLRQIKENRFSIILKSRQMGISTLMAGMSLHYMMFNTDFKILVIATKQDVAKNLVAKVQLAWDLLPAFLKQGIEVENNNKLALKFSNGSEIKAVSSSPDAARSEALSLLILDECAFIKDISEIWASSQMTLATGGGCVMLSTPNGAQGLFYNEWRRAIEGTKSTELVRFNPINLPWYLHPDRDQKWRDQQDEILGKRLAAQECDGNFATSGHTVIESEVLQHYEEKTIEPVERRGIGGELWIFKYPNFNKKYILSADVARGDGEDYSAFHVIDADTVEQVAEYKGKIDTTSFANMLVSVATEYNHALLVIDNRNIGYSTLQVAIDSGYKNLYYTYKSDPFLDKNIHLRKGYDLKDKKDMVPGYSIDVKTRPVMINKFEQYFSEKAPIIYSKRLTTEMFGFMWLDGKAQANKGSNDDLIMAFAIGLMVRDTSMKLLSMGIDLTKNALNRVHRNIYRANQQTNPQWEQQIGRGEKQSLKWLL
jgi:hypothetical protein